MYSDDIINYALQHTTEPEPILKELERITHLRTVYPAMLAGQGKGKLLEMLSCLVKPLNILEIGTFTGYSAICLAKGMQSGGVIHTIERNPEMEYIADTYFKKAGLGKNIFMHMGEATDIILSLDLTFDMVYIDGDKKDYPAFYELVINKISTGGLIVADNVLWYNKVTGKKGKPDKDTQGILEFNKKVNSDENVENILLPAFDGLMMIRKIR